MESTEQLPLFTAERQKHLLQVRNDLTLLPRGWMTEISESVNASRQFVSLVLNDVATFQRFRSNKAYAIWEQAEVVADREAEKISKLRVIISTLKGGEEIAVIQQTLVAKLVQRRIREAGLKVTIKRDTSTAPYTYRYTPKK